MAADHAEQVLALARDLERQDLELAARIEVVVELCASVDAVRADGRRVLAALEALPELRAAAEQAERDASAREHEARAELIAAEQNLDEVTRGRRVGDEEKAEAERAVRRAIVATTDAAEAVARMRRRLDALAADRVALTAEADGLAVSARQVAGALAQVPRLSDSGRSEPGPSLAEIDQWGARAHAALFVVRGGLERERESLVFEANALAAAVFGDAGGVSVTLVRERLEGTPSRR